MRVVGGRWRGRRLVAPAGQPVRPTTDRVKEALFNILGDAVADAVVLDLCCGSGGLGIEALSRGAAEVVFVDRAARSLDHAGRNLAACRADPGTYRLVRAHAVTWLAGWLRATRRPARWYLLADPPYQSDVGEAILSLLAGAPDLSGLAAAVLERATDEDRVPPAPDGWTRDRRAYGGSELVILRPGDPGPERQPRPAKGWNAS